MPVAPGVAPTRQEAKGGVAVYFRGDEPPTVHPQASGRARPAGGAAGGVGADGEPHAGGHGREHNKSQSLVLQLPFRGDKKSDERIVKDFFAQNPHIDALYFSTNYLCVKTLKILNTLFPSSKYGMVAFDDHELFELIQPNITCIRQPLEEIAKEIVKTIIDQLNGSESDFIEKIIPSELLIRNSSKK